jgi:hypothetical protein
MLFVFISFVYLFPFIKWRISFIFKTFITNNLYLNHFLQIKKQNYDRLYMALYALSLLLYYTARKVFMRVHYYIKVIDVTLSRLNKGMRNSKQFDRKILVIVHVTNKKWFQVWRSTHITLKVPEVQSPGEYTQSSFKRSFMTLWSVARELFTINRRRN